MSSPARDVAIYMPAAAGFYDAGPVGDNLGGGAELQTYLLARALAARGLRTAHIVWPVREPTSGPELPDVVQRRAYAGDRGRRGKLIETAEIWRSLAAADAAAYVIRGGGPQLLVAAAFAAARRRRLIFAAAIDLDFDLRRPDRSRTHLLLYRVALRRPDAFVAQTDAQLELARAVVSSGRPLEMIPSFVEPAERTRAEPQAFLWIGRLVDYKRPLEMIRLAEAVPEATFRMIYTTTVETPPRIPHELEAAAARLRNLELLGALPRPRVLEQIGSAFAVISTSRSEGMPNVFLEAWARGVPVISLSLDPGGRIAERELGLLASDSPERLAEAAERLRTDAALRARLGENALAYVGEVHDPTIVGDRWRGLVGRILGR